MLHPLQILIVEDRPDRAAAMVRALRRAGFDPAWTRVHTEADFLANLRPELDAILTGYSNREFSGRRVLELLSGREKAVPIIVISETAGADAAVEAMKLGACDYLGKGRLSHLGKAVSSALERTGRGRKRSQIEWPLPRIPTFGDDVMHSLTERKRVEESLKLFRDLMDHSIDTIEIVDPETGRFLDVNATGCASLGYTREEYLSMRVFDIDPMVTEAGWPERTARIRAAGSITLNTLHRRRRDGSTIPVEIIARWVRLDRNYLVAVVRDVTERHKAEERLREQAAMLDLASDAIIMRGLEDRKVSFWSKGAENLYGWSAEEAHGRDIAELIFQDPGSPIAVRNALMTAKDWRGESRQITKDGKPLLASTRATLVRDAAGNPKSVLSINTDITEQKKLEARYQRSQRMEAIGALAGGVAHDLGNILAPISIAAAALRTKLPEAAREELVSTIQQAAEHGIQIIRQILSFGRRLPGDMRPTRVGPLMAGVVKSIRNTFPGNIRIETALEPGLWEAVGDATQLYQVFLNLCLNAQDAMPDGGRLRLHGRNLKVDAASVGAFCDLKPGNYVMLEVSDTGTGIAAGNVEHVFEPFFTTKPVGKGTGLGLSTALGIVQSHGGSIDLKTQPGVGSAFQVCLPASSRRRAEPRETPARARPCKGNGELILLVDDEAGVRKMTRGGLERAGYRVLLASDGIEALEAFAANRAAIALVVTDLNMPRKNGMALIAELRNLAKNFPILVSTGLAGKENRAKLKAMKIRILNKPYEADVLVEAIQAALHPA